ncbi:MAG: nucleotidyltransferase domain-containing protein [Candidatus Acidiferrales bacterium]
METRVEGRRVYFRAEQRSPIFNDLSNLLEKTSGAAATLREALAPYTDGIKSAFLYGSVARGEERAGSDVDLMLIGSIRLSELAPALRRGETRLGREINIKLYSVPEFRTKIKHNDHFLTSVIDGKLLFIKNGRRDLGRLTGKERSQAA